MWSPTHIQVTGMSSLSSSFFSSVCVICERRTLASVVKIEWNGRKSRTFDKFVCFAQIDEIEFQPSVHMCMHRLKKHKRKKGKTTFNDLFSLHSLGILICFFVRSFFLSFSRVVVVNCVLSVVLLCSKCASLKWKEIMRSHARAHTHSTHNTHHSFNFLIHFSCDRVCTASSLRFFLFCSTLNEKQNY